MPIFYLINAEQFSMVPFVQPDEVMIVRYVQPLTQEQRQLLKTTMQNAPSCYVNLQEKKKTLPLSGTLHHQ